MYIYIYIYIHMICVYTWNYLTIFSWFWWGQCERSIGIAPKMTWLELPWIVWHAPSPPVQQIGLRGFDLHIWWEKLEKNVVIPWFHASSPCNPVIPCRISCRSKISKSNKSKELPNVPVKPEKTLLNRSTSGTSDTIMVQLGHFLLRSPSLVLQDATKKECCHIRQGRGSAGLPSTDWLGESGATQKKGP